MEAETTGEQLGYLPRSPDQIRYLMGAWTLVAILFDVIGNILVLVICRSGRIKLDKTSVIIIRNLSVADIGYSIYMMSVLGSIMAANGLFNERWCVVLLYTGYCFVSADVYLLCFLNINKLVTLKSPLRAKFRSARYGHVIVATIWIVSISLSFTKTAFLLGTSNLDMTYQHLTYECVPVYTDNAVRWIMVVTTTVIVILIPLFVTVVTTILLFWHIHRVRGVQKQTIRTLLLVSTVFTVSYLPYAVTAVTQTVLVDETEFPGWFHLLYQISHNLLYLNYAANPLIYIFTIKSFRGIICETARKFWNYFKGQRSKVGVKVILVTVQSL